MTCLHLYKHQLANRTNDKDKKKTLCTHNLLKGLYHQFKEETSPPAAHS